MMFSPNGVHILVWLCAVVGGGHAIAPSFSWDNMTNMVFFHSCNESGLFSQEALETIIKFPLVTIEKGQGFNDGTGRYGEQKIVEQCKAVKLLKPEIATVFYINEVLDWYFYEMAVTFKTHPQWWLRYSKSSKPFYAGGDPHFNPPKGGMLVFDHAQQAVRDFWVAACMNATKSGFVDGCFSDSSETSTHGTEKALNAADQAAFEAGKINTSATLTAKFGGKSGFPYKGSDGVLIAKKSDQQGINAYQIEFFKANEASITELMAGVDQGYLVEAHTHDVDTCGCACMNDTVAAFLIGAGEYSYYGSGLWISPNLQDVQQRWCPPIFEQPLGAPVSNAAKGSDGIYRRAFASGTTVEFNTHTNKGTLNWASPH